MEPEQCAISRERVQKMIMTLTATFPPEEKADVIRVLDSIIGPTMAQPGCLFCRLYSNVNNDDDLFLLEKWDSRETLEKHIRSDDFRRILAVMEMANEKPEMSFDTISKKEGLELVEIIRGN